MSQKTPTIRAVCGTLTGYRKHFTYGESPCVKCVEANATKKISNKIERGHQDRVQLDVVTIGFALLRLRELDPLCCERVRTLIRPEVADACMARAKNEL